MLTLLLPPRYLSPLFFPVLDDVPPSPRHPARKGRAPRGRGAGRVRDRVPRGNTATQGRREALPMPGPGRAKEPVGGSTGFPGSQGRCQHSTGRLGDPGDPEEAAVQREEATAPEPPPPCRSPSAFPNLCLNAGFCTVEAALLLSLPTRLLPAPL